MTISHVQNTLSLLRWIWAQMLWNYIKIRIKTSSWIVLISHVVIWLLQYFHVKRNIESNSNLLSMSINNRVPPKAPFHPNHISSACYSIMKCAGCVWACTTTAEIYGGLIQRSCFWVFWVLPFGWLQSLSRIAVGCDQQLVRRVMSPPAQHHAGAEHAQHLEETARVGEKTVVIRARVQSQEEHWWQL